ncbi:MAG: ELWxxDGT repeat protein [Bacteroidota bacterium]
MKRLFTLLLICVSAACFGQAQLLKKLLDPNQNSPNAGSFPFNFYVQGDKLFFTARTKEIGEALYVSDGTTAGTKLVKDFDETNGSRSWIFSPSGNNTIIIWGNNDGFQAWVTDGSAAGTKKLKDITGYVYLIGSVDGVVVWRSYSQEDGTQLWRTDGTVDGTGLLMDFGQSSVFDQEPYHNSTDDYLFFSVMVASNETDLWKTDGTPAGTSMVRPFSGSITPFKVEGNEFYFEHQSDQLWKTDGTLGGTTQLPINYPVVADFEGLELRRSISINENIFGVAQLADFVYQYYIWDHSSGDLTYLNINTTGGSAKPLIDSTLPIVFKGYVYFVADDGVNGLSLWRSDGTVAGTEKVTGMGLPNSYPRDIYASDDHIWVAYGGTSIVTGPITYQTWASDGTSPFVKVLEGPSYNFAVTFHENLYLSADDLKHSGELFKSNGTAAGTTLVADIEKATSLKPFYLFGTEDKLLFTTTGESGGMAIGASDGTGDGTAIIKQLTGYNPPVYLTGAPHNGKMIFYGADEDHGDEPWITDGTAAGTTMLADTEPGGETSYTNLKGIKWVGDKAFFFSTLGALWVTDGTPGGTTALKQFEDPTESNSYNIGFKGSYYFLYKNSLWKSDGTIGGTGKVKDISQDETNSMFNTGMLAGTDKFYFMVDDGSHGLELWVSDGTEPGTTMVKDVHQSGTGFTIYFPIAVINDVAYFSTGVDDNDDLWKSDGTPEGTSRLKDINPTGPSYVRPIQFYNSATVVDGNVFYFNADDGVHGGELWRSDGTEAGTVLVKDINPGNGPSYPVYSTEAIAGRIFFFADDGVHGYEPWRSDGTTERTVMIQDLNPGKDGSMVTDNPSSSITTIYKDKVFFIANAPSLGAEQIWWHDPLASISQIVFMDNISNKTFGDTSFTLNATASSGLPVTFSILSGPATISGNTLTITGTGDVHVKATQPGNNDFSAAFSDQMFTVSKADQAITFAPISNKTTNDPPVTLVATSTSGLPITFELTSGSANISGNILTITGQGFFTVVASQAGNDNYKSASAEQSFVVDFVLGLEDDGSSLTIWPNRRRLL